MGRVARRTACAVVIETGDRQREQRDVSKFQNVSNIIMFKYEVWIRDRYEDSGSCGHPGGENFQICPPGCENFQITVSFLS